MVANRELCSQTMSSANLLAVIPSFHPTTWPQLSLDGMLSCTTFGVGPESPVVNDETSDKHGISVGESIENRTARVKKLNIAL